MHTFLLEYMFEMLSCLVSLICFGDVNRSTAIHIFSFTQKKHACTSVCTMSCPYVGISKITNKKICARDVSRQNVWIKAQPFQHHHLLWMTFLFIIYYEPGVWLNKDKRDKQCICLTKPNDKVRNFCDSLNLNLWNELI